MCICKGKSKGMFGRVRTKVYRGYLLGNYSTEPYRSVWCGHSTSNTPEKFSICELETGTRHFGKGMSGVFTLFDTSCNIILGMCICKGESKGMFGRVRTKVYREYVLGNYSTEPYRSVWYGHSTISNTPVKFSICELDTGTRHFGKGISGVFTLPKRFGTASIRYRTFRYGLVRTRYRSPPVRQVRFDLKNKCPTLGYFGTTSSRYPTLS